MAYTDPLEEFGTQGPPVVNEHDTALLVSDELGGQCAVITRRSATAARASYRRWSNAEELGEFVATILFTALPAALGWALCSWVFGLELLAWDTGSRIADNFRLLLVISLGMISLCRLALRGPPEFFCWVFDLVSPKVYAYGAPLDKDTATPQPVSPEGLFARDVLCHASWETGAALTPRQRDALEASSGDAAEVITQEGLNIERERTRRTRRFAGHPLYVAQNPSLSREDVITHADLTFTNDHRGDIDTALKLDYADGRTTTLHYSEEDLAVGLGPVLGFAALRDLAEAQGTAIPYTVTPQTGSVAEHVMEPARSLL